MITLASCFILLANIFGVFSFSLPRNCIQKVYVTPMMSKGDLAAMYYDSIVNVMHWMIWTFWIILGETLFLKSLPRHLLWVLFQLVYQMLEIFNYLPPCRFYVPLSPTSELSRRELIFALHRRCVLFYSLLLFRKQTYLFICVAEHWFCLLWQRFEKCDRKRWLDHCWKVLWRICV